MTEKTYKVTMSDNELCKLLAQYSIFYYRKFKHDWKLHVDQEDIYGELAIRAVRARNDYGQLKRHTSNIRTYIISAMKKCMENYRKYLWVRQIKWPIDSLTND